MSQVFSSRTRPILATRRWQTQSPDVFSQPPGLPFWPMTEVLTASMTRSTFLRSLRRSKKPSEASIWEKVCQTGSTRALKPTPC